MALGAPNDGVKPVEAVAGADAFGAPKEGVKPVEAAAGFEVFVPLSEDEPVEAPNDGVNPAALDLGAEGPADALNEGVNPEVLDLGAEGPADALNEGVNPVLGAAACDGSVGFSGVAPLLMAFEKRVEVAVAGGLALGVVEKDVAASGD